MNNEKLKDFLFSSLAKYYSNLLIVYARIGDVQKETRLDSLKKYFWLLYKGRSFRPIIMKWGIKILGMKNALKVLALIAKRK